MKAKIIIPFFILSFLLFFCSNTENKRVNKTVKKENSNFSKHPKFNEYWYDGTAEITSYKLSQYRYGEIHEGTAVNILVTEDFLPKKQVKADYPNDDNVPILKLNSTKKFTTGIYPYSLMTSTFSPIDINKKAIKVSFSAQEWCGNTFVQLNNRDEFEIDFHSYFENNADRGISIQKNVLENDIYNLIRTSPESLPKGEIKMIPSFEYLVLNHKEIKSYNAKLNLTEENNLSVYTINYPELNRVLKIKFSKKFPYTIEGWEESLTIRGNTSITTAEKIKLIKSKYWSKNRKKDAEMRKELGI
jgi:hypothetical protein